MAEDDGPLVVEDEDLRYKLARLDSLKAERKEIDNEITVLSFELDAFITKTALFSNEDGITMRATMVRGRTVTVDLEYFRRNSPEVYERITQPKVDMDAVRRELKAGHISPEAAREGITITDNKPSVKFTVVGNEEEQTDDV